MKACFPADIEQRTVTVQQYNQLANNNTTAGAWKVWQSTQTTQLIMNYKHFQRFLTLTSLQKRIQGKFKAPTDWLIHLWADEMKLQQQQAITTLDEWKWINTKADEWASSTGQSVLTRLQGPLKCPSPKHLHIAGQPGDDIPRHVNAAVSHGLDLGWLQNSVPNIHLTQLAHKGLSSIKVPTHHVL